MALSRWMPLTLAIVACAACNKEPEKSVEEAQKAQTEAVEKASQEYAKANERATEAYNSAADAADKAYDKAADKWAAAAKDVAEAKRDFTKTAEDKLADVDKTLVDVREKVNTKKTLPANVRTDLDNLKARAEAVRNEVKNNIEGATAPTWETTKKDLEGKVDELRRSADDLKKRVQ